MITTKRKRSIRPSKLRKLAKKAEAESSGALLEEATASRQTIHLPSGPGRRLAAVEKLPTEIVRSRTPPLTFHLLTVMQLQEIFDLSENFHLPASSISFCRTLASSWLYQTVTIKAIRNPSKVWFLTRLLLCRFFTIDFFKQQILHKTNPELTFTLPPELISPKKYELAIALVDLNVAKLSEDMDSYYKSFLEKLCDEKNTDIVRRLLFGAEIEEGVESSFKITPRRETWEYLFKTNDVDLCVESVKEYSDQLGFEEDGHKWTDLASMGREGMATIEWLMQERNIIPPGDSLSGVFALSQRLSR